MQRVHVLELFQRSAELNLRSAEAQADVLVAMAQVIHNSFVGGGKVLLCGNGGSAADAQHFAAELLVRLKPGVDRRPLPAIALAMDSSTLTACANDYSFTDHFSRMLEALGRPGDVLLAISTSGRSPNVVQALEVAQSKGIHALGFLGGGGGPALGRCELALLVDSDETGRVQEVHLTAGHALLELVEELVLEARR